MTAETKYIHTTSNPVRNILHAIKRNVIMGLNTRGDEKLGIDASGQVEIDELDSTGPNAQYSNVYLGLPYTTMSVIFSILKIDYKNFDFVDYGSGKGRVICRAAQLPFKNIYGVELSKSLHEAALENIASTKARYADRISSINMDAVKFAIPENPLVCFYFSSFKSKHILKEIITKIDESQKVNKRDCYFVYINYKKEYEDVILENADFEVMPLSAFQNTLMRLFSPWRAVIYRIKK